jgi:hypothetical protein
MVRDPFEQLARLEWLLDERMKRFASVNYDTSSQAYRKLRASYRRWDDLIDRLTAHCEREAQQAEWDQP